MQVDKSIPSLAYFIAKRITNNVVALDCLCIVTGPKGSGKSTFSLSLAHEIAKELIKIKHKNELKNIPPADLESTISKMSEYYFNLNHLRSVDKEGSVQLFTGEVLRKENAVLVLDDFSITQNARDAMTTVNKNISKILTISRPFRTVILMNTIYSGLIDSTSRNFADIQIHLLGVNPVTKTSIAKVFLHSVDQNSGKSYNKFFRYKGKRIKYWQSHLPPKALMDGYLKIRMEKTNAMIDSLDALKQEQVKEQKVSSRKKKGVDIVEKFRDEVLARHAAGESIRSITRISPELSDWWVSKILATKDESI